MKGGVDQELNLPAGFRFHPTDEELVEHYLCRKCSGQTISVPKIIPEIDLYKFDPWQLPGMSMYGEKEWYFFSPRDRKYPNGSRPNRAAGTGYWKATGADKPVGKPKTLGIKKALVFYSGKAPRGVKSNWIMHEYRLANVDRSAGKRTNMKLDDWVLCRIYNKKGRLEKHYNMEMDLQKSAAEDFFSDSEERKPDVDLLSPYVNNYPRSMVQDEYTTRMMVQNNASETTIPKLKTESNSTERHVFSLEFNKEVESEPKWSELESCAFDFQINYMNGFYDAEPFGFGSHEQLSMFPDMIEYMQKPF